MITQSKLIGQLLAFGALGLLAIGCTLVLWPFLSAILWAAVICFSTWPAYRLFERALGGYRALAAAAMTVLVVVVIVAPLALLATTLADNISSLVAGVTHVLEQGPPAPPDWVRGYPSPVRAWLLIGRAWHTTRRPSPSS